MPLKEHHKVHLGNLGLFVLLVALLALPVAGFGFVRFEQNSGVLSEQDIYIEEGNDSPPSPGKFVKYEIEKLQEDVLEESTSSEDFDPVNYPPANIVLPE